MKKTGNAASITGCLCMEAFHVWNQTTAHWLSAYSNAALVKKQNNDDKKKNKQKNTKKQKTFLFIIWCFIFSSHKPASFPISNLISLRHFLPSRKWYNLHILFVYLFPPLEHKLHEGRHLCFTCSFKNTQCSPCPMRLASNKHLLNGLFFHIPHNIN